MFPQKFMVPANTPVFEVPPRIDGTHQYMPHQRMKNIATQSKPIALLGSLAYATASMHRGDPMPVSHGSEYRNPCGSDLW